MLAWEVVDDGGLHDPLSPLPQVHTQIVAKEFCLLRKRSSELMETSEGWLGKRLFIKVNNYFV